MGPATFVMMMMNTQQSGSLQPPVEPTDTGTFFVSTSGTGNGFTSSTPMSVADFNSETLTDDRIALFNASETL